MARPLHPKSKEEILEIVIPLFAVSGYNGISMRNLAKGVGMSVAAVYHHFSDKETLYLAAIAHAFKNKQELSKALDAGTSPEERLGNFLNHFSQSIHLYPDFHRLINWELLDGDEKRLRLLVDQVFREQFKAISTLAKELAPDLDPHLLAISLVGLANYHDLTKSIRPFLPGYSADHEDPQTLGRHMLSLLLSGLSR
ncbi:MAG: TetR/AcrR family transcriptional regulator [Magnetococcales bacterium]|nr:TetR/AcrR family transcriptional regulator [Magnetococcales bacterium]